jgi:hypothetical protein
MRLDAVTTLKTDFKSAKLLYSVKLNAIRRDSEGRLGAKSRGSSYNDVIPPDIPRSKEISYADEISANNPVSGVRDDAEVVSHI